MKRARSNFNRVMKKRKTLPRKSVPVGKFYSNAGALSGAALGGIIGNVPGAVAGYKVGKTFGKWKDTRNARLARKKQSTQKVLRTTHNDLTRYSIGQAQVGIGKYYKTYSKPLYMNSTNWVINGPLSTITATQGRQIIDYLDVIMHGNWLKSTCTGARHERVSLHDDLYEFDLYTGNANGPTSAVTKVYDRGRMYMKSIDIDYGFLSMTTVPQIVDVYWITPRFDLFADPIGVLSEILAFEGDGQDASTNATTIATNMVTAGKAWYDNWGFSPFKLKQFNQAFKVLKETHFTLNPGDQRHVNVKFKYNRVFAKEEHMSANYGRNRDWIKGTTVIPLVIVRAGLVGIATATEAVSSEVSYGEPKVGVTSCQKIKVGLLPTENRRPFSRVYKGIIEASTEALKEIDDNDDVVAPEKN